MVNEIRNWLENRGYKCRYIHVVNHVLIYTSSKISLQDVNDFNNDFGYQISLEGASFGEIGWGSEFEYHTSHKKLEEFSDRIKEWISNHSFPIRFFMITDDLLIYTYDKLSDEQIRDFETDLNLKCRRYSISCNSKEVKYVFS